MSKEPGAFDALLATLGDKVGETETLAKALPAEGEAEAEVAAAAAAGGEDGDEDGEAGEGLAKSFKLVLEDGREIEAVDGGELLKALFERVEANELGVGALLTKIVDVTAAQGDLIKSLQSDLAKLSSKGNGRKAVVTVSERPAPVAELAKSQEPAGVSPDEFMLKAMSKQAEGKLGSIQIAIAEQHLLAGQVPPKDIVDIVLG